MRRFLVALYIVVAISIPLVNISSAQYPITPGFYDDMNMWPFREHSTFSSINTASTAHGGNYMNLNDGSHILRFYAYGARNLVIYRQTASGFDDGVVCVNLANCKTIPNDTPFEVNKPFLSLNFFDSPDDPTIEQMAIQVDIFKQTANSSQFRVTAIHLLPLDMASLMDDLFFRVGFPGDPGDAIQLTPDGATIYQEVQPEDPEATPQVTAYRYEVTAGDTQTSILLLMQLVAMVLILVLLIFISLKGRG